MAVSDRMKWGLDPRASVPEEERIRDACGVGVVADIKGRRSHDIVKWGLEVLVNLGHRGALNADPETGDGAGILVQMPDAFFRSRCASLGIQLPPPGEYAVGTVFLPTEAADRSVCELLIEGAVAGEAGADISMFMSDIVMSTGRVWGWFSLPQCSQTQTLRPSANVTSPQLSHLRLAELGSMQ